jgi:hypothetical protein
MKSGSGNAKIQDGVRRHFELLTEFNKILNTAAAHHAEKNY